jgi:predicted metal-dependent HD superfamily phosphohydrolase
VAVVCGEELQRARVKVRDGASDEKVSRILAAQLSTATKAAMADFVVDTSAGLESVTAQLDQLMNKIPPADLVFRARTDFGDDLVFRAIHEAYSTPGRHYHTLSHLQRMFRGYDEFRTSFSHPRAVSWAIWGHDFVYETDHRYQDNEARSVHALTQLVRRPGVQESSAWEAGIASLGLACELIMATKGHKTASPLLQARPAAGADARLFLDLDLEILSANETDLQAFEDGVRAEFAQYDNKTYAAGRIAALRSFLDRDHIYFSPQFAGRENVARKNLRNMISHWSAVAASP